MTDWRETAPDSPIRAFLTDSKAMIPLALVGVLLLVGALLFVSHVDTQDEPDENVDVSVAIEQTESVVQTTIRKQTQATADTVAAQPLTNPNYHSEWGEVLLATPLDDRTGSPFNRYLRAMVYLDVADDLAAAGQTVDDVNTTVTLPSVESADDLDRAIGDVTIDERDPGELQVTLENVTITATRDGTVLKESTRSVETTVVSPIYQLHDRVETYQDALDAGVTETGFSQRFNARIYAIGWMRGWAQNQRAPVVEVMANRHIEPSANAALYRTQQDVFGAADPALGNAVSQGWACMAMQDGEALIGESDSSLGVNLDQYDGLSDIDADDLCDASQYLLGDQLTGEPPAAPDVTDLLGEAPRMNETDELAVGELSHAPITELADPTQPDSFEQALARAFTIDTAVETTAEIVEESICDDPNTEEEPTVLHPRGKLSEDPGVFFYGEATVHIPMDCGEFGDTRIVDIETTISTDEAQPTANITSLIDDPEIETMYERGPASSPASEPVPVQYRNFHEVDTAVSMAAFGAPPDTQPVVAYRTWASIALEDEELHSRTGVANELSTTERVELGSQVYAEEGIYKLLTDDIEHIRSEVAALSITYERSAMLETDDEGPFEQLRAEVESKRDDLLTRDAPFKNVGHLAAYETRYSYFELLDAYLAVMAETQTSAVDAIDEELKDVDSSIDDAMTFLHQGITAGEPDPIPIESSTLTDNITYEVSGSPTYLVDANVTRDELPPVPENETFVPMTMKNENHLNLPYDEVIDGILSRLADVIGFGDPDAKLTFRMAADVLDAGELALAADAADDNDRIEEREVMGESLFTNSLNDVEDGVEEAIEEFETQAATEITLQVYPDIAACALLEAEGLLNSLVGQQIADRYPNKSECLEIEDQYDDPAEIKAEIRDARAAILDHIRAVLAEDDSTAARARTIGEGEITPRLQERLSNEFASDAYRPPELEDRYGPAAWENHVTGAVPQAVTHASSMDVEVGDAETVEFIDESIQAALANVSDDILDGRFDDGFDFDLDDEFQDWVGNWGGNQKRPARVPAGLPLLPIPGKWKVTVNAWDINVAGEYARFELTANMGTPDTPTGTTYVREDQRVEQEIAGEERLLGAVEPIAFEGRSHLIVVVPPGVGVGDRDDENPECAATYPEVGVIDEAKIQCEEPKETFLHEDEG